LALDVGMGCIAAHVLDQRATAAAEHSVHLGEGSARVHEVLEGDKTTPSAAPPAEPPPPVAGYAASALDILLDGVEKRVKSRP
ncbi:MAG: hypothetical protein ACYDAL_09025, partial [Candidatus Dormibacteraceae bacterium]